MKSLERRHMGLFNYGIKINTTLFRRIIEWLLCQIYYPLAIEYKPIHYQYGQATILMWGSGSFGLLT